MKIGKRIGLLAAFTGVSIGSYFSVAPVIEAFLSQLISGQQAGVYIGTTGIIVGLSCAAVVLISYRAKNNT